MSAAERLRALDGRLALAQGSTWDDDWLLPTEPWVADVAALRNALPAIIAVVEAAEAHLDMEWAAFAEYGEPEHGDVPPNTNITHVRVGRALATLSQALEPGGDIERIESEPGVC